MSTEVLIIDDDQIAGNLSEFILKEAGFSTNIVSDGRLAVEAVRKERPRAVLLDIMMPGVDGLTICQAIKSDPELRATKVIIVSGKSFKAEKERAQRLGADLFIEKPYSVDDFAQRVAGVVGRPERPPKPATTVAAAKTDLEVRIWGCRSHGASGGKTPCVSVEVADQTFIFDAGLGILDLGKALLAEGRRKDLWMFLTHFHQAHVEGLGLFAPTRADDFSLRIGAANDPEKTLEACVRESFERSFASDASPVKAAIRLLEFQAGDYDLLPGIRVRTLYANHPSTTLAYRLEAKGKRVVYCPDGELYGEEASAMQDYDELLGNFCRGADLLIHDSRYNVEDYAANKNSGHSSVRNIADLAGRSEVARLVLFHMDAKYDAAELERMVATARQAAASAESGLDCQLAREGLAISL